MARTRAQQGQVFQTKSEFAYNRLRELIAEGELTPGSRLVLRKLAEELGLSEMPVREALRMLQQEGFVEFASHRGATVVSISSEEVLEGISVRMWLEALAVREATPLHTDQSLAAARRALDEAARAQEKGDPAAFSLANRRFHQAVEAPAGALLRATIDDLWNRVWRARRSLSLFTLRPEQMKDAQWQHRELMHAIEHDEAEEAAEAMLAHRASSLEAWRKALGLEGSGDPA